MKSKCINSYLDVYKLNEKKGIFNNRYIVYSRVFIFLFIIKV